MNKNEALGIVYEDLQNNRDFGSLFQFWRTQVLSEILEEFNVEYGEPTKMIEVDYNIIDDLSIKIVKRLSQEI